jgi:hypothetical protein
MEQIRGEFAAGRAFEAARYAGPLRDAREAMESAMEIMEGIGFDCESPQACEHAGPDDDCCYSALKRNVVALAALEGETDGA